MKTVKAAFKASIPIMAGYIFLGIAFGVLLSKENYNFLWALGMSIFIYAGSMQMVAVSLLAGQNDLLTVALTTLTVNARHIFYGIAMLSRFKNMGKYKPYMIFSLTDETFSLLCSVKVPKDVDERKFKFFISLFDQCYWIIGCVVGNILGSNLPFSFNGIDFVMTAFFTVVAVEQWLGTKKHSPHLVGLFAAVFCLFIFGKDKFLIPAMLLIAFLLIVIKKPIEGSPSLLKEDDLNE